MVTPDDWWNGGRGSQTLPEVLTLEFGYSRFTAPTRHRPILKDGQPESKSADARSRMKGGHPLNISLSGREKFIQLVYMAG